MTPLVVPLFGLVALLTGCSSPEADGVLASTPGGASTDPASAGPSTTEQPGPVGAAEQAAATAALEAYNWGWAVLVQSRRDPAAKPDWELDYRQYLTDPELSEALAATYGMRDAGLAYPTGEPVRDPAITSVDLEAQVVEIRDCVDLADWPQVSVATGEPNLQPQPPFVIQARVTFDAAAGRWLVTEQTPDTEQSC